MQKHYFRFSQYYAVFNQKVQVDLPKFIFYQYFDIAFIMFAKSSLMYNLTLKLSLAASLMVVVVVVVYFILSRLLYLALSANLGLLYMPHPGMGPLV